MPSRVIELVVNDEPRELLAAPGTTLLDGAPVMACLVPVETIEGASVRTLEGVTRPDGELDEVQAAFLEGFATQCGFCTAGMIMAAQGLLAENPDPSRE